MTHPKSYSARRKGKGTPLVSSHQKKRYKELDKVFSRYIRLRDTDEYGYGQCISSGEMIHFENSDAGHFVSRGHYATRWDEKNVNLQKRSENRDGFIQGMVMIDMEKRINQKWGANTADFLRKKGEGYANFTADEIEEKIKEYRQKVRQLEREKMFL